LVIADGPGGRDTVLALEHAEVLAPETRQGGAVDLGAAADEVVDGRMERPATTVKEWVRRAVALRDEHFPWTPVLGFARQVPASLDDQDLRAEVSEAIGHRSAAHAAADDRDIGGDRRRVEVDHDRPSTCD